MEGRNQHCYVKSKLCWCIVNSLIFSGFCNWSSNSINLDLGTMYGGAESKMIYLGSFDWSSDFFDLVAVFEGRSWSVKVFKIEIECF